MIEITLADYLVLATLIVLIWEVYLLRRSIQMQTWQDSVSKITDLEKIVLDKKHINRIFYETESDKKDKDDVQTFIELYLLAFEMIYVQRKLLNKDLWTPWERFIRNTVALPEFRRVWNEIKNNGEFHDEFNSFVNSVIQSSE